MGRTSSKKRLRAAGPAGPAATPGLKARGSTHRLAPFLAIAIVTFIAYAPAWHGQPVWDDDAHLTPVALQSASGLPRIWFELGATQQYYPLTHSAFWLQHQLWGQDTTGYHLVNIALHVISAGLVGLILTLLRAPGPWIVAAIFALHPIQVESVAWISELKNTLSGVFALGAVLAYLRFDETRRSSTYAVATTLFVCALLSKTVTAMVPAALIVVLWWRHGRISMSRDLGPLAPWLVLGAIAGLGTAWIERTVIGAAGASFDYTIIERTLIAGRALWFYATSLLWPANLSFNYPRWDIDQTVWGQYLFPLAAVALAIAAWRWRSSSRAPLAGMGWFAVMLFPALGFFNVYPFRYSFVADHFQYLACIGLIALLVAGLLNVVPDRPWRNWATMLVIGLPLAGLTMRESRAYVDATTLYRTTLERNPESWLALTNLGVMSLNGRADALPEAISLLERSVAANPDNPEARSSLGLALTRAGRFSEARTHLEAAIGLDPKLAGAHNNLGGVAERTGDIDAAGHHYEEAVRLDPGDVEARLNLGSLRRRQGRLDEGFEHLHTASRIAPARADVQIALGLLFEQRNDLDRAASQYEAAIRLDPSNADAPDNLGIVRMRQGRLPEAEAAFREVVRLNPSHPSAHFSLATLLQAQGRLADAVPVYERALAVASLQDAGQIHNDLGVALAQLGRLRDAIAHFESAVRLRPDLQSARDNLTRARAGR